MELRQRKSNRLEGYDYGRPGYYFITVCIKDRWPILCRGAQCAPASNVFPLSHIGEVVSHKIEQITIHYPDIWVDKYVVMPNHVHMILVLKPPASRGRTLCAPTPAAAVPKVIKAWKEAITKSLGYPIWQKSYHDHIIRNEADYRRIWHYIDTNPARWLEDCFYIAPNCNQKELE